MVKFSDKLELAYSISIMKLTWVYWGLNLYDFINIKYDYQTFKEY